MIFYELMCFIWHFIYFKIAKNKSAVLHDIMAWILIKIITNYYHMMLAYVDIYVFFI